MAPTRSESPAETIAGLKALLVDYAKQETIDPLRGVGRYLGYGLAGAVLVGFGLLLLALAGLRALQTETGDTFGGSLQWLPYLIVLVGIGVAIAILVRMIRGGSR